MPPSAVSHNPAKTLVGLPIIKNILDKPGAIFSQIYDGIKVQIKV